MFTKHPRVAIGDCTDRIPIYFTTIMLFINSTLNTTELSRAIGPNAFRTRGHSIFEQNIQLS